MNTRALSLGIRINMTNVNWTGCADDGIKVIQLHDDWNDSLRMFGGDRFAPVNPAGFRRFIDMVHARGLKVVAYTSSGFFDRDNPDFREEWARKQDMVEIYLNCARCSPASAGWRAYVLPKMVRIMDEYGVDGLYNDNGYVPLAGNPRPPTQDEVLAFEESTDSDGALADLLALIYSEVKRRGGIYTEHNSGLRCPKTDMKVYDYLIVGEAVERVDQLRQAAKNHPPYVNPILDMSRAKVDSEDEIYVNVIPYMQFPLTMGGRPMTGERAMVEGVKYKDPDKCYWGRHHRAIRKHYLAHPDGPHVYGWWDSVPPRPEARPTYAKWLKRYVPMVEEGTRAYLEITDTNLFAHPLPENVVASAFANRQMNLVLANYNKTSVEVATRDLYFDPEDASAGPHKAWTLNPRSMVILHRLA